MKYQRFVAYVYEYRKGKKENNCGFLRVEARDGNVTVEVHIKCPGLPANEKCSIYGFVRNGGLMEGILLGDAWSETGQLDCMLESEKQENTSWQEEFPKFCGMVIVTENGAFFGTEWDDEPIKPENFEPQTVEKTAKMRENVVNIIEDTAKASTEAPAGERMEAESKDVIKEAKASTETEEDEKTVTVMQTEEATETPPAFRPFNDGEIAECRKVHPDEFFRSCPRACTLRNNRFLEHGYYNFGHLITGKRRDGQRILGVPGGYDQQERFMANMFGFPYFKESREIQLPGGKGGYWYRLINPANFH